MRWQGDTGKCKASEKPLKIKSFARTTISRARSADSQTMHPNTTFGAAKHSPDDALQHPIRLPGPGNRHGQRA